MGNKQVRLTLYEFPYDKAGPVGTVRFTEYGGDGKPVKVDQVDYWDEDYLGENVITALECGMDVTIFTNRNVNVFHSFKEYLISS